MSLNQTVLQKRCSYAHCRNFALAIFATPGRGNEIPIAVSGKPRATIQIGANASAQEQFAAEEIQTFIQQFTGAKLDILTNRQQTETVSVIVLGTPKSNPTIAGLQADTELTLGDELGDEGYRIKTIEVGTENCCRCDSAHWQRRHLRCV